MKVNFIILCVLICITFACENNNVTSDCYSPTQNLEQAYAEGTEGCACDEQNDQDICVEDKNGLEVALICENGKWVAVIDGPCMPQFSN